MLGVAIAISIGNRIIGYLAMYQGTKTIREVLEWGDHEAIRILGDRMNGVGGIGFDTITDIGQSLEPTAKARISEEIRKQTDKLSSYVERVEVVYDIRLRP